MLCSDKQEPMTDETSGILKFDICIRTRKCDLPLRGKVGLIMASMAELHIGDAERAAAIRSPLRGKEPIGECTFLFSVAMHLKACCVICPLMYNG